jgi:hypothetical protein
VNDRDDDVPRLGFSANTVDLGVPKPVRDTPFDALRDRFEVRGELGRGGMGRVDDAFDRALGRPVAIKHMLRDDPARFAREARITARLEHPGIVPLHEAGRTADGTPYYVMRRIDGRPLADLVVCTTLGERLALIPNILAACDAVGFAHSRGIVHRDIKPTNILVGPFGETLVIDWGLAHEIAESKPDDIVGTPGFVAPEQVRGEPVDARADVFALGATLFYTLAIEGPHEAPRETEMLARASRGEAPAWSALPFGVPADLRAILVKALASKPADRYRDAAELAADLRRFVTGNLVAAHSYSALARARRFVRRHRGAVAVAATSAIVLAIVAIASLRRIVEERDDATFARAVAVDTADHLLVDQAAQLATTDPIGAIVLLRRLDLGSTRWREAWLAATAAWTRGIPTGFHGDSGVTSVQLSADGRRIATASRSGKVSVYDLGDRSHRVVATLTRPYACQWIGALQLVCGYAGDHLAIIDTENAQTRELSERIQSLIGDRKSRALGQTRDRRVIEITDAVREIASDAEIAAASPDLAEIALWRGEALELRTATHTFAVASFPMPRARRRVVEIRDHTIAALIDDDVYRWRIEADRVVEAGHWAHQEGVGGVILAGDHVYGLGGRFGVPELRTIDGAGTAPVSQPSWAVQTTHGVVAVEASGALVVRDDIGWFRLGPYPMVVTRVDVSLDGRTLVGVTDRDDIVVWDLAAIRPRAIPVPHGEEPLRLVPPDLWTFDKMHGLVRRDLQTGSSRTIIAGNYLPDSWYSVGLDGRWAALRESPKGPLKVYDGIRKRTGAFRGVATQASDIDGIVMSRNDGTLEAWKPGDDQPRFIGRLPARPDHLAVRGHYVLAVTGELVRLDLSTMMQQTTPIANIDRFAIEASGRAWLVTESGELLRWDLGAAPVQVALPEPIDGVALTADGHAFAHATHGLIALDGFSPRAIAADSRWWTSLGAGYLATVSARGDLAIVDPETAGSVTLAPRALPPGAVSTPLVARGDTLVFLSNRDLDTSDMHMLDLPVPHEPAALKRWLAEVTNAEPAAGGRGAQWK